MANGLGGGDRRLPRRSEGEDRGPWESIGFHPFWRGIQLLDTRLKEPFNLHRLPNRQANACQAILANHQHRYAVGINVPTSLVKQGELAVNLDPSQLFDDTVVWMLRTIKDGASEGIRTAVARWFSRGDDEREQAELERLDRTAQELQAASEGTAGERVLSRQEGAWLGRFQDAYDGMDEHERGQALADLRALLEQHAPDIGASAGDGSFAATGDIHILADQGSIAAGVINGGASISPPSQPTSPQG
ncbi:hypothetical protein [Streptomyces sp. NPDC058695]|uniref:hypothetical protein n=1 Tax=Streptomyces sp. NPDC058695 TaxID=3346604 RepID=UPI003655B629